MEHAKGWCLGSPGLPRPDSVPTPIFHVERPSTESLGMKGSRRDGKNIHMRELQDMLCYRA